MLQSGTNKRIWPIAVASLVVVSVFAASGCSSLSEKERDYLRGERAAAKNLLQEFASAVRQDNLPAAMGKLHPNLSVRECKAFKERLRLASWLELYSSYQPNLDAAMSNMSFKEAQNGFAKMRVPARSPNAGRFKDRYVLVKSGDEWKIGNVKFQKPIVGEPLDFPEAEEQEIRSILEPVFEDLRDGRIAKILAALPGDKSVYHSVERPGWFGKLIGQKTKVYNLMEDLEAVYKLQIAQWPDLRDPLPAAYLSPVSTVIVFDIPYSSHRLGIGHDTLQLECFVSQSPEGWELTYVRVFGKALSHKK